MGVRSKKARKPAEPEKWGKILEKDVAEYQRISSGIRRAVRRLGDYDRALDEPHVEAAAKAVIYMRRNEQFLDDALMRGRSRGFARATDAQVKWRSVLDRALDALAANRRSRLELKGLQEVKGELQEAVRRLMGLKG